MTWMSTVQKLLDPYDIKARLFPGLMVTLPFIVFLVLTFGSKNPLLTALISIIASCGGPYILANFARTLGKRAEERLFKKWGGAPSTLLLRHRDSRLPDQTKRRYHQLISVKLGVEMPTTEQEDAFPHIADQAYAAAADSLRPMTNDKTKFPFIFKELVAYGYNRNAYGLKWVGSFVSLTVIAFTLIHAEVIKPNPPYWNLSSIELAGGLTILFSSIFAAIWLFHFCPKTVELAGYSYAMRLWEALEKVPKKSIKRSDS